MIHRSKSKIEVKATMLIAKLMLYLFLYDHYLACIWHYTVL